MKTKIIKEFYDEVRER